MVVCKAYLHAAASDAWLLSVQILWLQTSWLCSSAAVSHLCHCSRTKQAFSLPNMSNTNLSALRRLQRLTVPKLLAQVQRDTQQLCKQNSANIAGNRVPW